MSFAPAPQIGHARLAGCTPAPPLIQGRTPHRPLGRAAGRSRDVSRRAPAPDGSAEAGIGGSARVRGVWCWEQTSRRVRDPGCLGSGSRLSRCTSLPCTGRIRQGTGAGSPGSLAPQGKEPGIGGPDRDLLRGRPAPRARRGRGPRCRGSGRCLPRASARRADGATRPDRPVCADRGWRGRHGVRVPRCQGGARGGSARGGRWPPGPGDRTGVGPVPGRHGNAVAGAEAGCHGVGAGPRSTDAATAAPGGHAAGLGRAGHPTPAASEADTVVRRRPTASRMAGRRRPMRVKPCRAASATAANRRVAARAQRMILLIGRSPH